MSLRNTIKIIVQLKPCLAFVQKKHPSSLIYFSSRGVLVSGTSKLLLIGSLKILTDSRAQHPAESTNRCLLF